MSTSKNIALWIPACLGGQLWGVFFKKQIMLHDFSRDSAIFKKIVVGTQCFGWSIYRLVSKGLWSWCIRGAVISLWAVLRRLSSTLLYMYIPIEITRHLIRKKNMRVVQRMKKIPFYSLSMLQQPKRKPFTSNLNILKSMPRKMRRKVHENHDFWPIWNFGLNERH